jgi:hypothetical protein
MRFSEPLRRVQAALRTLLCGALLALAVPAAMAHKSSDAYLQLDSSPDGLDLRLDIALRDLDAALDLDADADGRLTWGEVKAGWPAIDAYVASRLRIEGCALATTARALERRSDGAYAALSLHSDCRLAGAPQIVYRLFGDIDPTHRGIARVRRAGDAAVQVQVLDPARAAEPDAASASSSPAPVARERFAFVREGIHHIVTGYDHLLFLLCLLLPAVMRRTPTGWAPVERLSQAVLPVLGIVTAFTLAHSLTLGLAATGLVSLPSRFIEPAIALTIVLAAIDNVRPLFGVRRGWVTFAFGLVHGFGFAGVLAELDLPTRDFAWALLQFNLGLEAGQALIVLGVTGLLYGLRRHRRYPAWAIRGGSYAAMAMGMLWLIERTAGLKLLPF